MVNGELREGNRARNSLLSYFVSASSRSFTSRRLLGFITLKNSRISMSVFIRSAISCLFTCVKSRVQRLIARNYRFRFKLKFKADRVQLKMVQRTIAVNQFTAAYLIEFTAEPRWCNRPLMIYYLWRYWQGITPSDSAKVRHSPLTSENLTNNQP